MKIVRIEQGKLRIIVRDVGDMEVQKPHGKCTSLSSTVLRPLPSDQADKVGDNSQIG